MKTPKKIIDAYVVRIIKRGDVIDNDYKPNDVNHVQYREQENNMYDVHYYDGGNCVHKEYSVSKDSLKNRFIEWEVSHHSLRIFSRYKMLEHSIQYV
jgi:hypothetical protein